MISLLLKLVEQEIGQAGFLVIAGSHSGVAKLFFQHVQQCIRVLLREERR